MTDTEEITRATELQNKAERVLNLLGFAPEQNGNESKWSVAVHTYPNDEGLRLYASASRYEKWRLAFSASYPRTAKGEYVRPTEYNETPRDKITVSPEKSVETIVADVQRRLMPVAREYLARVKKKVQASDDYERTTISTLQTVKGEFLTDNERRSHSFHDYKRGIQANVSGGRVDLKLDDLTAELACKIIALLPAN